MHIKVEEDKNLVRDISNGAILNTNKKALSEYRRNRVQKLSLQFQVDNLTNQVSELTDLVNKLIKNNQE